MLLVAATLFTLLFLGTLQTSRPVLLSVAVALLLVLPGLYLTLADTRWIVFVENDTLYWADHQGKKRFVGEVKVKDIAALRKYYWYIENTKRRARPKFGVVTTSGAEMLIPQNGGGGTRLLNALRAYNSALEIETIESKPPATAQAPQRST